MFSTQKQPLFPHRPTCLTVLFLGVCIQINSLSHNGLRACSLSLCHRVFHSNPLLLLPSELAPQPSSGNADLGILKRRSYLGTSLISRSVSLLHVWIQVMPSGKVDSKGGIMSSPAWRTGRGAGGSVTEHWWLGVSCVHRGSWLAGSYSFPSVIPRSSVRRCLEAGQKLCL